MGKWYTYQDTYLPQMVPVYAWCMILMLFLMDVNKVRNLHCHIQHKFGKESARFLRELEDVVKKIANFQNHRRYSHSGALRQVLSQLVVDLKHLGVFKLSRKLNDNFLMKGLEASIKRRISMN